MMTCAFVQKMKALGAEENVPLSTLTTFKIGGPARLVLRARDTETLAGALRLCYAEKVPFALLGNGSDVLAPDEGFEGVVIRVEKPAERFAAGKNVRVFAGELLANVARETVHAGYAGLERLAGIPASVGGACAMNAGAYGGEIKDTLASVLVFRNGEVVREAVDRNLFGYRVSPYSFPKAVVLEAEFALTEDDGTAAAVMEECMQKRREKQPLEFPSAGSVFKRPEGNFAGKLIEDAGLKGTAIGGASVSPKHAGFIVNNGGATAKDVLALVDYIEDTVERLYGVRLEREVRLLEEIACTF